MSSRSARNRRRRGLVVSGDSSSSNNSNVDAGEVTVVRLLRINSQDYLVFLKNNNIMIFVLVGDCCSNMVVVKRLCWVRENRREGEGRKVELLER